MNYHRLGITALVLILFLTLIYMIQRLMPDRKLLVDAIQIGFEDKVPSPITHGDVSKRQVIFTFDGGEGSQSAFVVLDILRKHHARGTFFLTGKWVLRNPDLIRRMQAEGHEIYNHSLTHPHLPFLTDREIANELGNMDRTLLNLINTSTKPYFRPPYGDYDERVLFAAARHGYRAVMWTIDAGDWMESEGFTADAVRARIYSHIEPGAIVLMHLGDDITGLILDEIFTQIEDLGYKIVSLTQGI
ncbi:MAG: hypothetical protein A3G04_02885 [Candidatus Taylorbacteria bacterium RIFCSPLOWO2_12_FULL_44_9]|nr:MAG: hypothetical protein A3G04_02885 [Candidatus Taylorbacteria bacterium RIFCSPLOWO2_12_FULL_44_9]